MSQSRAIFASVMSGETALLSRRRIASRLGRPVFLGISLLGAYACGGGSTASPMPQERDSPSPAGGGVGSPTGGSAGTHSANNAGNLGGGMNSGGNGIPLAMFWDAPAEAGTDCDVEGKLQGFYGAPRTSFESARFTCPVYLCACLAGLWKCADKVCVGQTGTSGASNSCSPDVERAFDCQCGSDSSYCNQVGGAGGAGGEAGGGGAAGKT